VRCRFLGGGSIAAKFGPPVWATTSDGDTEAVEQLCVDPANPRVQVAAFGASRPLPSVPMKVA